MKNYEQISKTCKLWWSEGLKLNNERYTQVSGYIFNDQNQLLIVKNKNSWTIPGGHPEPNEAPVETLEREILEESCTTIKNIKYLGALEVVENDETYYQLRYTAKALDVLPFKKEWETSERLFVDLNDLHNYIPWSKGVAFSQQIESAKNVWNI
ncbi:MAG: NUDIX domain-containing protein [Clostridia bacterium]|jgi:ADP-ribose pyrophosphatase YjhB (NUDIX family)|nr:NUDIX domain-containing protein [Clostridia bacterium]